MTPIRHVLTAALAGPLASLLLAAPGTAGLAAAAAATAPTAAPAPRQAPTYPPAYDLAGVNGEVTSFGGAGYFGQASRLHLTAPIVGMAVTPDGGGYWLVGSDGGVFSYGDARFHGSTGNIHLNDPIVGIAGTPDGRGYWLVASDGGVFAYGDARFRGSTGSIRLRAPVVGMAATGNGLGYWLVASDGGVFTFGNARYHGSTGGEVLNQPVVAMAAQADAGGYWLLAGDGGIFGFGTSHYQGSAAGLIGGAGAVGIAPTPDGRGYWVASSAGKVLAFGDAVFHGDLTAQPSAAPTAAIVQALAVVTPPPSPYPAGSIGYDVNWPQCSGASARSTGPLPGPPSYPAQTRDYAVAVVGVDGWAVDYPNQCLSAEVAWAQRARGTGGASYDLYMLLNAPASSSTIDATGPGGVCSKLKTGSAAWQDCLAFNYGWNSAVIAFQYAGSEGASSQVWWLDIENTSCADSNFNGGFGAPWSCDPSLNDQTIQAAIDALHDEGVTVGVYSTSLQWGKIAGNYDPHEGSVTGIPLWIAGAPWTVPPYPASSGYPGESALSGWCSGGESFGGGTPWLLQETPGPNNYPFDPDIACGGQPLVGPALPRGAVGAAGRGAVMQVTP